MTYILKFSEIYQPIVKKWSFISEKYEQPELGVWGVYFTVLPFVELKILRQRKERSKQENDCCKFANFVQISEAYSQKLSWCHQWFNSSLYCDE